MSTVMMDSMTLLMIGNKPIILQLRGSRFCTFLCHVVMLADFKQMEDDRSEIVW